MFILTGLALLFTAGFHFGAAQVDNYARNYTVHLGDTCDAISAAQNSSTSISLINHSYSLITMTPSLQLSARLGEHKHQCWMYQLVFGRSLPPRHDQDCTDTCVVVSGDNCVAIAAAEGTTYDILLANNPNVDATCANIYPGEVLCVAPEEVYA